MSGGPAADEVRVARVVPNVTGLDKQFDYLVPSHLAERVTVGSLVRVVLHGRRVGGWVVSVGGPDPSVPVDRLLPIDKWSSYGPGPEVLDLAEWASVRWAAGRLRPFLVAADPPTMVTSLPRERRRAVPAPSGSAAVGPVLHWTTPLTDPLPIVQRVAAAGPCLVIHPSPAAARAVANRLRKLGRSVALLPDDWGLAAAGVDVVVGGRSAVWGPCPGLRSIVVLDEHDESLQEERVPTWHARDVAIERARRAAADCLLVSPTPTLTAVEAAGPRIERATAEERRHGWPLVQVVDRGASESWRSSLVSSELIAHLRDHSRTVVCVLNTTGRARLLACRSCRAVQRCASCEAAVVQDAEGSLECRRCGAQRPPVCQSCGSTALLVVRPGVTRLREELEAAANRPAIAVAGPSEELPPAGVYVGTEAVLHRVGGVDTVAFLDIDGELLAPRYRAAEHTLALLVRAARLVGRAERGTVLVQTFVPEHEVLRAVCGADVEGLVDAERVRRRTLGLPPFRALALVEGEQAGSFAASTGLEHGLVEKGAMVRADDWSTLGAALTGTSRPKDSKLRIAVDPQRV